MTTAAATWSGADLIEALLLDRAADDWRWRSRLWAWQMLSHGDRMYVVRAHDEHGGDDAVLAAIDELAPPCCACCGAQKRDRDLLQTVDGGVCLTCARRWYEEAL